MKPQQKRLAAALLAFSGAGSAASAQSAHMLDKINITGLKSVPEAKLRAALQEQVGTKVTTDDIVADQANISKVLQDSNVVGGIQTSMATKPNGHIEITFAITDNGVQAPVVTHVAPKLDHQEFVGNKKLTTDALVAASGLKPGDDLSDAKIQAAQAALAAAYKAAKQGVSLTGQIKQMDGGKVVITWSISELAPKKADDN